MPFRSPRSIILWYYGTMLKSWGWEEWYQALQKPSWTPSGSFIGAIWTILYPIVFITFGIIFYRVLRGKIPFAVALPFLINLAANFAFTPLQFGLKNLLLASLDILIVWAAIIWGMVSLWPYSKNLALLQIPYLTWVTIASFLQFSITFLNR